MNELADRCPQCMAVTPEIPVRVSAAPGEGVRADYRCGECGHEWFTCWLVSGEQVALNTTGDGKAA